MDELDQVIMDALIARPWILHPTLPRNDKQTFEMGVRCGWDARAATKGEIRISRELITRLLAGDPVVRALVQNMLAETGKPSTEAPTESGTPCRACGRPYSPTHDAAAAGPTARHPFKPAT